MTGKTTVKVCSAQQKDTLGNIFLNQVAMMGNSNTRTSMPHKPKENLTAMRSYKTCNALKNLRQKPYVKT